MGSRGGRQATGLPNVEKAGEHTSALFEEEAMQLAGKLRVRRAERTTLLVRVSALRRETRTSRVVRSDKSILLKTDRDRRALFGKSCGFGGLGLDLLKELADALDRFARGRC